MNTKDLTVIRNKAMELEFSHMNEMQKKAVFQTEGPLLILAGAGSGKTTVLVNRIANLVTYGNAYNSDVFYNDFSEDEINLIKDATKAEQIPFELKMKLSVNSAKPWQILAITFTNKAAGELKERIAARIPNGNDIWAATFHSTCARILRRYGERIGYTNKFTVYDSDDQKRLIKDILKSMHVDEKILPHRSVLSEISKAKDKMMTPEAYAAGVMNDSRKADIAKAYALYTKKLKSADAMDFDDMLCNTVKLFEENEDVLEYYQNLFRYIMVDEYQDTNQVQYRFVSLLAQKSQNICVVGDDDQSIYKFRGATIENILNFEHTYPNATVIRLEQNYRSTQNILNAANKVIENNEARKGKTLWTENTPGEKITLHKALSERDEASYITNTILEQVSAGKKFSDFAVLYRTNAQSNTLEQYFSRSGVPHRIIGGHRFYDREEIKDMTAYLQVINNPSDDVRLRRIINKPKRAIGETTVNHAFEIAGVLGESVYSVIKRAEEFEPLKRAVVKLKAFTTMMDELIEFAQNDDNSISELYSYMLEKTNYINHLKKEKENSDTRIENVNELKTNIVNYEKEYDEEANLSGFLEEISLLTDIDNYDSDADSVVMMTLHAAKGLEFPVVFIPGMEDGIFPGMQSMYNPEELQEERRLAYVGITRAKEKLYLLHARSRMIYASTSYNKVSRFINEIPAELLDLTEAQNAAQNVTTPRGKVPTYQPQKSGFMAHTTAANKSTQVDTSSYSSGDKVSHKAFGDGVIVSSQKLGNDTLLEISFNKVGTKKLMANFAKLTKE